MKAQMSVLLSLYNVLHISLLDFKKNFLKKLYCNNINSIFHLNACFFYLLDRLKLSNAFLQTAIKTNVPVCCYIEYALCSMSIPKPKEDVSPIIKKPLLLIIKITGSYFSKDSCL